ncbi:putative ankyrin repeat protein RF_0381 isoform X2 [Physella acuta]|uniref:putative ankyrin repeat protein RF_0381 isoform X2 n=1 Tax=Physella acuta TaxID=109671 RepID=UPI0027DDE830|nr:putative ankyrin repeat protein RF_0381 isoform X2 [Physella acuta]
MHEGMMLEADQLRFEQVLLYKMLVTCKQQNQSISSCIHGVSKTLLQSPLTLVVVENCTCGRFFEQHPTTVEDTEAIRLGPFLQTLQRGTCKCWRPGQAAGCVASKTWLHVAAALGSLELLEHLVTEVQLNINSVTSLLNFTSLTLAVMQTRTDLVEWLCSRPDVDKNVLVKSEQHTALVEAMLADKFHIVELLIQSPGLDLNTKNFRGETPLVIAVRMKNAELVKQLLQAGADHSIPTRRGLLPLLLAVSSGHKVVREFVHAGVDLNLKTPHGETALTLALQAYDLDVVHTLITGGASTVADPARPAVVLAAKLADLQTTYYLLQIGEDPNQQDSEGWTALHYASWHGRDAMVEMLLAHGADPNCLTSCHGTALSMAVFHRHSQVVELLLASCADPNIADTDLDTALHLAAANGDQRVVESLLAAGAQACALNRAGATPLFNAVVRSSLSVVRLLLPHYTDVQLQLCSRGTVYSCYQSKSQVLYPTARSLMWVAATSGSEGIVQLLLYAGYDCSQQVWLDQTDALSPAVRDQLAHCMPRTLLALARCVVRRLLGPGNQRHVNQLRHIPRAVQNYISLRTI